MIDNELNLLNQRANAKSLEALEADVWAGVEARATQVRALRKVAAWQSMVLALAVVSSLGVGAHAATSLPAGTLGVFSPHGSLSPATLLGGH